MIKRLILTASLIIFSFVFVFIANAEAETTDLPQTIKAYRVDIEGREYLQEGYINQQVWQDEFNSQLEQAEYLNLELLQLEEFLDDESIARINDFNRNNFIYIEEVNGYIANAEQMKKEALAAKERQLEQQKQKEQQQSQPSNTQTVYSGNGSRLTQSSGVNYYNGNKETYYNLDMSGVIANAQAMGIQGNYWVRSDGVRMYGDYVIVAAQMNKGSIVQTSLGTGIVLDWCQAGTIDIATTWG